MMQIRHGRLDDLEAIVRIEGENFSPQEASSAEAFQAHLRQNAETFLVAEINGEIAGYIEGPVIAGPYLTDDLFHGSKPNPKTGGIVAVTSLSIAKQYKQQGLGTALIAALKDVVVAQGRDGITLTCHDYLIPYYEMNGFEDHGESESKHGNALWYNMTWRNPESPNNR